MEITHDFIKPIIELRHQLHACAELSGEEKLTAGLIQTFLQKCKPSQVNCNIGGYGLVATFDSGKPGPVILFRSELDALPIHEINHVSYRSVKNGVSHKCGHDGHMAILCGLAAVLSEEPPVSGKVVLLFQPAEETGEGAEAVCKDAKFNLQPDLVFALHNIPGATEGLVIVKDGTFSAAVNSMVIRLNGKATHAAQPESGLNPANAVADITRFCDQLNNNDPASKAFRLATPIYLNVGSKAYGTAAGEGEIHFTLRAWNNDALRDLEKIIEEAVAKISAEAGLTHSISYTQGFYANTNNAEANNLVRKAAVDCGLAVEEKNAPFKWGEDFGFFTSKFKGCMFGLGAGIVQADLHNPDYDFPDSLIPSGVKMFYRISKLTTGKHV
jgi:amidohydrolase